MCPAMTMHCIPGQHCYMMPYQFSELRTSYTQLGDTMFLLCTLVLDKHMISGIIATMIEFIS